MLRPKGVNKRPLILVHGLWDDPLVFRSLINILNQPGFPFLAPHLSHRYGRVSLKKLASNLEICISKTFGNNTEIDLLGFSMGGIISRVWLQQLGGYKRTYRFFSIGSPHQGTCTAHCVPPWLFPGIADMRRNSPLLNELNDDTSVLNMVCCISYFCAWDLMVFPGRQAVLPVGRSYSLPVMTHRGLVSHPLALKILARSILKE